MIVTTPHGIAAAMQLGMDWAAGLKPGDVFMGAFVAADTVLREAGLDVPHKRHENKEGARSLVNFRATAVKHAFVTGALMVLDHCDVYVRDESAMDINGQGCTVSVIARIEEDRRAEALQKYGRVEGGGK